jgi:hypothetical protein
MRELGSEEADFKLKLALSKEKTKNPKRYKEIDIIESDDGGTP